MLVIPPPRLNYIWQQRVFVAVVEARSQKTLQQKHTCRMQQKYFKN